MPSRLGQVWWPELGITKADVLDCYDRIADIQVPHLRDRPFTLKQHEVRESAGVVAAALARGSGGLVTAERASARRHGVFVDVKMNGHGQQVVAPYSLRPVAAASVATPLRWDEVVPQLEPAALGMAAVLEWAGLHGDLAAPLLRGGGRLTAALRRLR